MDWREMRFAGINFARLGSDGQPSGESCEYRSADYPRQHQDPTAKTGESEPSDSTPLHQTSIAKRPTPKANAERSSRTYQVRLRLHRHLRSDA